MSPLSHTLRDLGDLAARCDALEFERRYGPSLRRIVRHMLRSGGGPAAWRPWLSDELKRMQPPRSSPSSSGDETVRRLADKLGQVLRGRGPRTGESRCETLAAV